MKSKLVLITLLLISFSSKAESDISSCEKYFAALESCMKNAITFYSEKDKKLLQATQNSLKEVNEAQAAMREKKDAELNIISQYCSAASSKKSAVRNLNSITEPLIKSQSLNKDCAEKIQEIKSGIE